MDKIGCTAKLDFMCEKIEYTFIYLYENNIHKNMLLFQCYVQNVKISPSSNFLLSVP